MKVSDWTPPVIAVIGMGVSAGDLGATALEWITSAQVLAGGKRHLDFFPDHPGERIPIGTPLGDSLQRIGRVSLTKRTVVLASGDPLFFGIGRVLADEFGKERIYIHPNVTSVQAMSARLREPWGELETVSLHGRDERSGMTRIMEKLQRGGKVAVFTDRRHTPKWIAKSVLESGGMGTMVVAEDLGTASEKIREFTLAEAAGEKEFSPLNIVLLRPGEYRGGKVDSVGPRQVFGFFENEFEREAGLITKMEVRAVVLAVLRLEPGQILWDIGAGTGSVSIEAARIAPLRQAFAIEKEESRYSKLRENLEKFGVPRVKAICGAAPGALETLPDPDRVFIGGGGSGEALREVLQAVAGRITSGGVVVQTVVLLETLGEVKKFWTAQGFHVSVTQLQASRSVIIGKGIRLEALNPVFIISSWRE